LALPPAAQRVLLAAVPTSFLGHQDAGCGRAALCCAVDAQLHTGAAELLQERPSLSWIPGSCFSAAPVSTPTVPSTPSSITSCPRNSGRLSRSCAGAGWWNHRGAQHASSPAAAAWPVRHCWEPRRHSLAPARPLTFLQRGQPLTSRSPFSAWSEDCPAPHLHSEFTHLLAELAMSALCAGGCQERGRCPPSGPPASLSHELGHWGNPG
jgi:hypothetical protein